MKLLHVDASAKREWSNSRALSRYFVERLRERLPALDVDYLDVAVDTPPHVSGAFAAATYAPPEERNDAMKRVLAHSDALCERLLAADLVVFAMPMYNWSMPSAFKAYIDSVIRPGVTYRIDATGKLVGQLDRQKVLFITTRGADLRPGAAYDGYDGLTPALRAAFRFIGVDDPAFVDAQPLQFADPEARAEALARAQRELAAVAGAWAAGMLEPAL